MLFNIILHNSVWECMRMKSSGPSLVLWAVFARCLCSYMGEEINGRRSRFSRCVRRGLIWHTRKALESSAKLGHSTWGSSEGRKKTCVHWFYRSLIVSSVSLSRDLSFLTWSARECVRWEGECHLVAASSLIIRLVVKIMTDRRHHVLLPAQCLHRGVSCRRGILWTFDLFSWLLLSKSWGKRHTKATVLSCWALRTTPSRSWAFPFLAISPRRFFPHPLVNSYSISSLYLSLDIYVSFYGLSSEVNLAGPLAAVSLLVSSFNSSFLTCVNL